MSANEPELNANTDGEDSEEDWAWVGFRRWGQVAEPSATDTSDGEFSTWELSQQ